MSSHLHHLLSNGLNHSSTHEISDRSQHFSLMETRPGRCCQDGHISTLHCGDAAATWRPAVRLASLVSGRGSRAGRDVEQLQATSMLNYRPSEFRKVGTRADRQFADSTLTHCLHISGAIQRRFSKVFPFVRRPNLSPRRANRAD